MIIKLQSTEPESLGKEEGSREYSWTILKMENRINFADGLEVGSYWRGRGMRVVRGREHGQRKLELGS